MKLLRTGLATLALFSPISVAAVEGEQLDYAELEKPVESEEFKQISSTYNVGSEGVSTYYYNTTVYGVRAGETDVETSTADITGLGEDICVGNPTGDNSNMQYPCVVLPESLADEYGRGDTVFVAYEDSDGIYGIFECVVIDFNQTEHGDNLNFVGEFTYTEGDTAWIVEEK